MEPKRKKLFATDLDGTLVDRDGRIHPRDREAIANARARGVVVTIATGRLTTGTHPVARALGLDAPLVCADGGVISCGGTERVLERSPIETERALGILDALADRSLASFVFTDDAVHSCERGRAHHDYVAGWSTAITTHDDVQSAPGWRSEPDQALMVVGIGSRDHVVEVDARVREAAPDLETLTFGTRTGHHVVRFIRRGVSKGSGLAAVARRLDIARGDVAVAGDWHNDVPMFAWAGSSYAMPHAPEELSALATCTLDPGAMERGAIAEALERWLAE